VTRVATAGDIEELTLLTGFPGFRATYLVHALARSGQNVLLVLPESAQAVAQTLRDELGADADRVEVVASEPWAIDFGLGGSSIDSSPSV